MGHEEGDDGGGGHLPDELGGDRPDGGGEQHDVPVLEGVGVAAALEVLAECHVGALAQEVARRLAVEALGVPPQGEEVGRVALGYLRLGEFELGRAVVEATVEVEEVESAGVVQGGGADLLEERGDLRVGAGVEDDEGGVDPDRPAVLLLDLDGQRVASGPVVLLVHGDFDVVRQVVGGGQSGYRRHRRQRHGWSWQAALRRERYSWNRSRGATTAGAQRSGASEEGVRVCPVRR